MSTRPWGEGMGVMGGYMGVSNTHRMHIETLKSAERVNFAC